MESLTVAKCNYRLHIQCMHSLLNTSSGFYSLDGSQDPASKQDWCLNGIAVIYALLSWFQEDQCRICSNTATYLVVWRINHATSKANWWAWSS